MRYAPFALVTLALSGFPLALQAGAIVTQTYSGSLPATITGTLPNQGTALEETFTLSSPTSLKIFTTSYATGGFQPTITLFNSAGNYLVTSLTSGSSPVASKDPTTGMALDAYLADSLAAGTYIIALTDWELNQSLTATNLSAGFTQNYGNGTTFIDEGSNTRTGNYTLDITSASAAASAVPEPATFLLFIPCLLFAGLIARKRCLTN